jgi:hypothetical protein
MNAYIGGLGDITELCYRMAVDQSPPARMCRQYSETHANGDLEFALWMFMCWRVARRLFDLPDMPWHDWYTANMTPWVALDRAISLWHPLETKETP